jgi:hypothetical protein
MMRRNRAKHNKLSLSRHHVNDNRRRRPKHARLRRNMLIAHPAEVDPLNFRLAETQIPHRFRVCGAGGQAGFGVPVTALKF